MTATDAPSWVVPFGTHNGDAIFEDEGGMARLPLDSLPRLRGLAERSTNARVTVLGRRYDRDNLAAVLAAYDRGELPPLDSCATTGCDEAAPYVASNARPACHDHAKD